MKTRTLLVLVVLALVLVGLATWSGGRRSPSGDEALTAGPLLPELEARINELSEVAILGAGDATVATLVREDDRWIVAERDGWPADTAQLRNLLLSLSQARRLEAKTSNPELHHRLGVEALAAADAAGAGVRLGSGAQAPVVIVGQPRGSDASYVRMADQPQAWLVDRLLEVPRTPQAWLDRELLQVDATRVAAASIVPPDGKRVQITARDDGPGFALANAPKGRTVVDGDVEGAAGLLSSLRIEDVARAGEAPFGDAAIGTATFLLRDGLVFELRFQPSERGTRALFEVSLDTDRAEAWVATEQAKAAMEHERQLRLAQADAATATSDPAAAAADGEADAARAADVQVDPATVEPPLAVSDPAADREQRLATLRGELAGLQQRLHGWVFTLPAYKAGHLLRPFDDYLAPES